MIVNSHVDQCSAFGKVVQAKRDAFFGPYGIKDGTKGLIAENICRIFLFRVMDEFEALTLGDINGDRRLVEDDDLACTSLSSNLGDAIAGRAATDDENCLVRSDIPLIGDVNTDGEDIEHGSLLAGDVIRNRVATCTPSWRVLSVGARKVWTVAPTLAVSQVDRVGAEVPATIFAVITMAADFGADRSDSFAKKMAIVLGNDCNHGSRVFMTEDDIVRILFVLTKRVLSPRVLAQKVAKVGTADAACLDFDHHQIWVAVGFEWPDRDLDDF